MTRVIGRDGQLTDYIPRPGDPRPTVGRRPDSRSQKWGGRFLISNVPATNALGIPSQVTVIQTGDLTLPTPVNIQLRFAANGANRQPILPFLYPLPGVAPSVTVTIRRGVDPSSSPTIDTYTLLTNDVLPIDMVTARDLGVEVSAQAPADVTVWVEAIAAPVHDIGPVNKVQPWFFSQNPTFIATNPAPVSLLAPNSDRVQFFICNTSTNADLLVQLGRGPNLALPQWLPFPLGSFILPRNRFAVYESPAPVCFKGTPGDGVRGSVYGIWSNAGDGGAMIHEGTAF